MSNGEDEPVDDGLEELYEEAEQAYRDADAKDDDDSEGDSEDE